MALQWVESICQTDKVVISGFHSPLEKEVLNIPLERHHPVIFALGRALYKKVPPHLQAAFVESIEFDQISNALASNVWITKREITETFSLSLFSMPYPTT